MFLLPPHLSLPIFHYHPTMPLALSAFIKCTDRKERNNITIISIKAQKKISIKPIKVSLPVVILISVLQEKQGVEWMSLPYKSCYAHYSIQWTCSQEIDGRRRRRRKNLDTRGTKTISTKYLCFRVLDTFDYI
jgi:hypothetical protein